MDKLSSFFELSKTLKSQNLSSGEYHGAVPEKYWLHYKPLVLRLERIETNNNNINKDKNGNFKNKDKHNNYNEIINDTN